MNTRGGTIDDNEIVIRRFRILPGRNKNWNYGPDNHLMVPQDLWDDPNGEPSIYFESIADKELVRTECGKEGSEHKGLIALHVGIIHANRCVEILTEHGKKTGNFYQIFVIGDEVDGCEGHAHAVIKNNPGFPSHQASTLRRKMYAELAHMCTKYIHGKIPEQLQSRPVGFLYLPPALPPLLKTA